MRQGRLSTKQIVLLVKDRLDDLRVTDAIPDTIYQRKANPKMILEAINNADMDVCGLLDLDVTAIAFIPAGVSEFNLFSQDTYQYEFITATADSDEVDPQSLSNLLNTQSYVNYGKMRGSVIQRYNVAPIGSASPSGKYRIVSSNQFSSYKTHGYLDIGPEHYDGVAVVMPEGGRARLSDPAPCDLFLTWDSTIMPSKMDIVDMSTNVDAKSAIESYQIATPTYAKELLLIKTMLSLLPPTINAYKSYASIENKAYQQALSNVARGTQTFRAEPYLGPS